MLNLKQVSAGPDMLGDAQQDGAGPRQACFLEQLGGSGKGFLVSNGMDDRPAAIESRLSGSWKMKTTFGRGVNIQGVCCYARSVTCMRCSIRAAAPKD